MLSRPAGIRIPSYAVWEVVVFVLNVLAFNMIGMQLRSIGARLDRSELLDYTGFAVAMCAVAILARFAWVLGAAGLSRMPRPPRSCAAGMSCSCAVPSPSCAVDPATA